MIEKLIEMISTCTQRDLGREAIEFATKALDWKPVSASEALTYKIILSEYEGGRKIQVIKAIRECTGLGLKEAKEMSEATKPVVLITNDAHDAFNALNLLEEAGARASIKMS